MPRTAVQNEALAGRVAELFVTVLRQMVGFDAIPREVAEPYEVALVRLDREELWQRYHTARSLRIAATTLVHKAADPAEQALAERVFTRYGFLARAMIAPATAFRGRASAFIALYVDEGIVYATRLCPTLAQEWAERAAAFKASL